jgi:hypothetical protein
MYGRSTAAPKLGKHETAQQQCLLEVGKHERV